MSSYNRTATIAVLAIAASAFIPVPAHAADQGKVCSSLGKVHANRARALFPVQVQSIDGKLSSRRNENCLMLDVGKHELGLTAATEVVAFPKRRMPRGALKEMKLPIEIEANRTYTLAAQLDDRYEASWIPVIERVELWSEPR